MADDIGHVDKVKFRLLNNALVVVSEPGVTTAVEPDGHGGVADGTTTVTTAGTAVQLSAAACKRVLIQAHEDNTDAVAIGASTVVASKSGRRGMILYATQSAEFLVSNLNLLFVDAAVSTEKINFYYET